MSHPFRWVPADGQRHASRHPTTGGGYPPGLTVSTLCGLDVHARTGDLPWLWPTCADCNLEARRIVGAVIRFPGPAPPAPGPGSREFRSERDA